jgi:hypothetical protein
VSLVRSTYTIGTNYRREQEEGQFSLFYRFRYRDGLATLLIQILMATEVILKKYDGTIHKIPTVMELQDGKEK